jgi:hypothetical protein
MSYPQSQEKVDQMKQTSLKAIRMKCVECAGSPHSVRGCTFSDCALYPYRLGRNPNRSGIGGNPLFSSRKVLLKLGVSSPGQEKMSGEGSDRGYFKNMPESLI